MSDLHFTARSLDPADFQKISRLARERFGLDLGEGKQDLVTARLLKNLRMGGFQSFREYYDHVIGDPTGEALTGMIDALTTQFTMFLREPAHFDFLRKTILPSLRQRPAIEVWSAAAATGEEPYSVALLLLDELGLPPSPALQILATDVSTAALRTGSEGTYPAERLAGVPPHWLRRYCVPAGAAGKAAYRMRPEVRSLVEFRSLNLIETVPHRRPFPVIFCRNVLIYFGKPVRQKALDYLCRWLEPGGHLFIGHSETLSGLDHSLEYVRPAIYRKAARERTRW